MSEPKYRIQLADLISGEVERIVDATSGQKFALQVGVAPDSQSITARVRAYEAICETLLGLAPVGGFWAEESHYYIWQKALTQLSTRRAEGGYTIWVNLQCYPATLLLYSLGLGAIEAGRLEFLGVLFATTVHQENREDLPAIQLLPAFTLIEHSENAKLLEGMDRRHAPLNDWLHNLLKQHLKRIISNENRFTFVFDKLEILMALGYAHHSKRAKEWYWAPPGAYGYRNENRERILKEIDESLAKDGGNSIYVISRIFGDSVETCTSNMAAFRIFVNKIAGSWW